MTNNRNEINCAECDEPMFYEAPASSGLPGAGVSHHAGGGMDGIDYDADADHVPYAEENDHA